MNYCWTSIKVSDLEVSIKFYHDLLELPVGDRYQETNRKTAMLGEKFQPTIELVCMDEDKKVRTSMNIIISVLVVSLDRTVNNLIKNHVKILRGPLIENNQTKVAFVLDPDGYEVQLIESI